MLKLFLILFTVSISAQSWWWSWSTDDTQAPSVVTSPSAVGDVNKVTLTWTDPTESDFDSVRIYAGTTTNPTTWVASVAKGVQSYKDSNYSYNTIRHYRIKSKDRSGNLSAYTSSVNDTVLIWLGSELITNGGFDADANWTKLGTATISGGRGNIVSADGTLAHLYQAVACTTGLTYRCTLDVVRTSGSIIVFYNTEANLTLGTISATGSYSYNFVAGTTGSSASIKRVWICDVNIDNVSIKRILNP